MIVLERVSKAYDAGSRYAVRDVSLRVPAGQLLVLLGGSGSGKTTTLKMINRLIEPTSGRIEVDGRDVRALDPVQLRRGIGYVFQGIGLFPHLTVAENVAVVPRLLGWPARRIAERVDELLELVRLPPEQYRARLPRQLSGGQQQRVGFARALAADPRVLLLDEPFGALDAQTREVMQHELERIWGETRPTILFVTHDIDEAILLGDRVVILRDGRLVQCATPAELLLHPADPFVEEFVGADRAIERLRRLEALRAEGKRT